MQHVDPTGRPAVWGPQQPPQPEFLGQVINPFLASGGVTFYIVSIAPAFDPRPDGAQLLASVYVPKGWQGFVKELRVAPGMPPELADPWEVRGAWPDPANNEPNLWRTFDAAGTVRVAGTHGIWQTPFGWESYFDVGVAPPSWTWQLRLYQGDLALERSRRPAFTIADPASWWGVANIPTPAFVYGSGLPGKAPSGYWGAQRMQVLQGDKLSTHVFVPEDHTILLWARWTQAEVNPFSHLEDGEGSDNDTYGPAVFPIQPSFGQLHGYMQPVSADATKENALYGWQG